MNCQNASSWFFSEISGLFCMYIRWHPSNWKSSPSQWMEWLESEESSSSPFRLGSSVGSGPRSTRPMSCRHGVTPRHWQLWTFRTLFDPFWLQKSGEHLGLLKILTAFHAIQKKTTGTASIINTSHHQPTNQPPLVQTPFHHHFSLRRNSGRSIRLLFFQTLPFLFCPALSLSIDIRLRDLRSKHQIAKLKLIFQTVWGGETLCMGFFVDWSLEVCRFLYVFLDDFGNLLEFWSFNGVWSNDNFMDFFLNLCKFAVFFSPEFSLIQLSSWTNKKRSEKVTGLGRSFTTIKISWAPL